MIQNKRILKPIRYRIKGKKWKSLLSRERKLQAVYELDNLKLLKGLITKPRINLKTFPTWTGKNFRKIK